MNKILILLAFFSFSTLSYSSLYWCDAARKYLKQNEADIEKYMEYNPSDTQSIRSKKDYLEVRLLAVRNSIHREDDDDGDGKNCKLALDMLKKTWHQQPVSTGTGTR